MVVAFGGAGYGGADSIGFVIIHHCKGAVFLLLHQHRRGAGRIRRVDLVFGGALSKLAAQDGQGAESAVRIPARLHGEVVIDKPVLIGLVRAGVVALGVGAGVYPAHLPALGRLQITPVDPLQVVRAHAGLNPEQIGGAGHHDILEVARGTVDSVKQLLRRGGLHPAGVYRRYFVIGGGQRWRFRVFVIPPRRVRRRFAGSRQRYRIGRTQREVALPQGGAPF